MKVNLESPAPQGPVAGGPMMPEFATAVKGFPPPMVGRTHVDEAGVSWEFRLVERGEWVPRTDNTVLKEAQ